jgi:hypothetical protein
MEKHDNKLHFIVINEETKEEKNVNLNGFIQILKTSNTLKIKGHDPAIPDIHTKIKLKSIKNLNNILKNKLISFTNKEEKYIIKELIQNLKFDNYRSSFYLTLILSEYIVDRIIIINKDKIKNNNFRKIKKFINIEEEKTFLSLGKKIDILKTILPNKTNTSQLFKNILELLNLIRNRYLFHFTDLDDYSFVIPENDLFKKEQKLQKHFIEIKKTIADIIKNYNLNNLELNLLIENAANFQDSTIDYSRLINIQQIPERKTRVNSKGLTSLLPKTLSKLSMIFLLFLNENNLKLILNKN